MSTRRKFIYLSGISLAGLITKSWSPNGTSAHEMAPPDNVEILVDTQWFPLTTVNQVSWQLRDVLVTIKQNDKVLPVKLQAPNVLLSAVRLIWKFPEVSQAQFLGDQWERTYGDSQWQAPDPEKKYPWYLIRHENNDTLCMGVRTGCSSICYWQLKNGSLQLVLDTKSGGKGVKLGGRTLNAAEIITTKRSGNENAFATTRRFCKMMCENPRLPKKPVYGINDWYFAYGNNSAESILSNTRLLAPLAAESTNLPFSVIDAGWAIKSPALPDDCCWGDDFAISNSKFGDMTKLAAQIKESGMRPGLWTRPLCARQRDRKNLLMPAINGRNDPKTPFLDPTIEENIQRIKRNIAQYAKWGYELVKHDYTTFDIFGRWGFDMQTDLTVPGWQFNDNSLTNAEIILHLYKSIREAAGSMYLIGCNTISHLSAGIFELNRIGDDTSGNEWERTRKMGVNTLGFRIVQHNTFYAADADCVGLTTKIPWEKNKQWMHLLAESGTPLFISCQPEALGTEQKEMISRSFAQAAKQQDIGEPLDWLTNPLPVQWKLNGKTVNFNWS